MQCGLLTEKEGNLLLKIARDNIRCYLENKDYQIPEDIPSIFREKLGVFVTLNINNNLRGCIGYPEPYKPLIDAVLDVSIAAAVNDPRFMPLTLDEFQNITIEISVLTKPTKVIVKDYNEYLDKLEVGVDGLIIESDYNRGLLLPQVPIEQNWDIEEFLENLCYKAGLASDAWVSATTDIFKFQAQIFQE